ncbi:hypothetical protein PF008_g2836 [Phytophthora fragariae]|uniref:Secreted protein n=1 Tax=Phytophthora fragariae TaxID=53985 RepID=A0A6G0SGH8_9STRA|nr:hypothetical protein PF008_g2836 [Phytophthora fragariae]
MSRWPPLAALFMACAVQPSLLFSCSHWTTSKCPLHAAPSIASVVHPSNRCSCSHWRTSKCPLTAAPTIAMVVHLLLDPFSCSNFTTCKCPQAAASSIARGRIMHPELSYSHCTTSNRPLLAAWCSGAAEHSPPLARTSHSTTAK